ncbi:MAG: peptide deformylase [Planctomycetota bacterium]|nr:peptide deformylase [Planctomycetota bacterium]
MLRIVPYPHPALRYESRPIATINDALRARVREMFDLMYAAKGIGLAANQVGLPLRFFILNLSADPGKPEEEVVFLNPEIVKRHASIEGEEGCLSFPGLYSQVQRARKVRVQAFNLEGQPIDIEAHDLFSRAIQHELDHLDGNLFIDRLTPDLRDKVETKVRTIESGFRKAQAAGEYPSDAEILRELGAIAATGAVPSVGEAS